MIALFVLIFILSAGLLAQPQYYNYNNGTVQNMFPLNTSGGKMAQMVIPPGNFYQPGPAPAGNITKFHVYINSTYPLGPATYTTFKILFRQWTDSVLTAGSFLGGTWDTVYQRASVTLTAAGGTWLTFILDHPFSYVPTQSLVVQMEQCAVSGTFSGYSLTFTTAVGYRRNWSVGGCPYVYSGVSTNILNSGIDVAPASSNPLFFTQWCSAPTFPVCPTVSIYNSCAVLGDTLYCAVGSVDGTAVSTLVYRYSISGNSWTAGIPVPVGKAQATLTKCNGKLYLVGGGSPNTNGTTDVYEYTPSTGTWTLKAPLPTAKSGHSTVCWGDSVLIVAGGSWSTPDANVYVYRPASNTWSTSTSFIGPLRRSQAGGIVGNKIYIAGGYPFTNTLVIGTIGANANTITWAAGPPFPSVTKSRLGGVGVGDRFYMVGGNNSAGTTSSDSTFIFQTTTNTWTALASVKPSQSHNISSSVVYWKVGDSVKVACVGGTSGTVTATNSFHVIACGPTVVSSPGITNEVPSNYSLEQNYPNPFNPSTKINFSILKSGMVELKVYDILGREVAIIVNEYRIAGNHTVDFNASNLASGVYLYTLKAGDFTNTKKMLLIK